MTQFGEAAERLAGQASLLLGWGPAVFWTATPAELATAVRPLLPDAGEGPLGPDELRELIAREEGR